MGDFCYTLHMRLSINVIPNASKSELVSKDVLGWKIRLAAPPVDGKANQALIEFLADYFNCAKSAIRIIKGQTRKKKIVEIEI